MMKPGLENVGGSRPYLYRDSPTRLTASSPGAAQLRAVECVMLHRTRSTCQKPCARCDGSFRTAHADEPPRVLGNHWPELGRQSRPGQSRKVDCETTQMPYSVSRILRSRCRSHERPQNVSRFCVLKRVSKSNTAQPGAYEATRTALSDHTMVPRAGPLALESGSR